MLQGKYWLDGRDLPILDAAIEALKYDDTTYHDEHFEVVVAKDVWEDAKKAFEKQIPKEPIWEGDGYADGEMVYDTWYCPNCDTAYEDSERHKCCPVCGQVIDWSEQT